MGNGSSKDTAFETVPQSDTNSRTNWSLHGSKWSLIACVRVWTLDASPAGPCRSPYIVMNHPQQDPTATSSPALIPFRHSHHTAKSTTQKQHTALPLRRCLQLVSKNRTPKHHKNHPLLLKLGDHSAHQPPRLFHRHIYCILGTLPRSNLF